MTTSKDYKVLILSAVFPPEPVVSANLSNDTACALSERNTVTVLSPKPSRPFGFHFTGEPLHFNFKHIQVGSYICASSSIIGRFKESYSFGKHCYRYIADNHQNIDVIYANTWPLMAQYYAVKAANKFNIPIIIHVQDIYPESLSKKLPFGKSFFNRILLPLDKYLLSHSTKVIAISEKMKEHLKLTRKINEDKIEVVRNWQDESAYLNFSQAISNKLFTFMYLGSISPAAGVDLLIHSFHKADLKNAQLIIAGNGSDREHCIEIASHYENVNIHFIDALMDLVPSIQSTSDILILPLKKGIGLTASPSKLPSYMFSAKPVIACVDEDSDTANVITSTNCGWVIPPEDQNSLIKIMNIVAGLSGEELQQKGLNGFKYAIEHFSKRNNLKKLSDTINETIPV